MKMKPHVVCGWIAAFLACIRLLPQLYKTLITKSVDDLSICFLFLFLIGGILMLIYAYFAKAYPIIVTNIFNITVSTLLIIAYYQYHS